MRSTRSITLLTVSGSLLACSLFGASAAEQLTIDVAQTMGMSMFRGHWDQPIPSAEDGATGAWNYKDIISKEGRGSHAVWSKEKRNGKPGALAFDALNRSAMVRFPKAAEKIAALINSGKKIDKVEIVLPFLDEELFPVAKQPDWPQSDSYDFKSTFGTFETWTASRPQWHAIAYALPKPWTADEEVGPKFLFSPWAGVALAKPPRSLNRTLAPLAHQPPLMRTNRKKQFPSNGAERKQPAEVKDSGADRTCLRLHEPAHERILPALHWAAAQYGSDWPDQPDLQPGPLRTDRAIEVAATERRLKTKLKPKTNENQSSANN